MEQQYTEIVLWMQAHVPPILVLILSLLGALVTLGVTYVAMTPSQDDDAWLLALQEKPVIGHILKFLQAFSPVAKKEGKLMLSNKKEEPKLPEGSAKV